MADGPRPERNHVSEYSCFYCAEQTADLQTCVDHVVEYHGETVLKLRTKIFNERSGKFGLVTKNFNIVPSNVLHFGQWLQINESDWTIVVKEQENVSCENMELEEINDLMFEDESERYTDEENEGECISLETSMHNLTIDSVHSPFPKKIKCSTPFKEHIVQPEELFKRTDSQSQNVPLDEMITMMPSVLEHMKINGHLETWLSLNKMIADGLFPFENISFLLFMDVCRFLTSENTSAMKYNETVKRFWRIGYRLFHGKWLKFMSGPKHTGTELSGTSEKGEFDPAEGMINFAVPIKSVMSSKMAPVKQNEIKPGILSYLLDKVADDSSPTKTYKVCLDGKKINASTSGPEGDIDLWGFEHKPTLKEKRRALEEEKSVIAETVELVNQLAEKIKRLCSHEFSQIQKDSFIGLLRNIIEFLSKRISSLRKMAVQKETSKDRLKKEAGEDWKKSKLVFVISGLITSIYDIKACISNLLKVIDEICRLVASIYGQNFSSDSTVKLEGKVNYMHFAAGGSEPRFTKQRSKQWFNVRENAAITGSTCNDAIGLRTLKKQVEHFDEYMLKISKPDPSDSVKEMMAYGTDNEINAIATLVAKVLPVLNPELRYFEEGCYPLSLRNVNVVVSPDGSCRTSESEPVYGVEVKCPFPGKKYTTQVLYTLPKYYVTQVLLEMKALNVKQLYFTCYSEESTTVQLVTFDEELWSLIEKEIYTLYGGDKLRRPTKRSENIKLIQQKIEHFVNTNVRFIMEVLSVKATECIPEQSDMDVAEIYCTKHKTSDSLLVDSISMNKVQEVLYNADENLDRSYQLTRNKASEFLGFMISDLDREYSTEALNSVPIAYGLKGYSLPTATLRNMLEFVLQECSQRGLYVPVCSFDGQWYRLVVRDRNEKPLTILQLQRDVYNSVKQMSKSDIIKEISSANKVEVTNFDDLQDCVDIVWGQKEIRKPNNAIVNAKVIEVKGKKHDKVYKMSKETNHIIQKKVEVNQEKDTIDMQVEDDVLNNVPDNVHEMLTTDIAENVHAIITVNQSSNEEKAVSSNVDQEQNELGAEEINHDGLSDEQNGNPPHDSGTVFLDEKDLLLMLSSLKGDQKSNRMKKWEITLPDFQEKLLNASTIARSFLAYELQLCLRPVISKFKANGLKVNTSSNKHTLVNAFSQAIGDGSSIAPTVRKRKSVPQLKTLAKTALQKLSKAHLNILFAENIFPAKLENWYQTNPFGKHISIASLECSDQPFWYSQPEMNDTLGYYIFMVLDVYHQLCGARRLFCANGMPAAGINSAYIHSVAENSSVNGCGLNTAHVKDLIDKQSVAFAVLTFSEKIEECLKDIGAINEAYFCRLIRNWYRSEDEPGISALDRCKHRIELRKWLLSNVNFGVFPPPGAYVKDIPIVLYEGLLTGIERRIQLFSFSKTGSYNVRAVGSLDIENFFGGFQDIDPFGKGVLRPDNISAALSIATELTESRMNPNRGFHMYTSVAKVYPCNTYDQTSAVDDTCTDGSRKVVRDLTTIKILDHQFDSNDRRRGKTKRKLGNVSKPEEPGRRPLTIREHHRTHEAKILPHVRRGLVLKDDD